MPGFVLFLSRSGTNSIARNKPSTTTKPAGNAPFTCSCIPGGAPAKTTHSRGRKRKENAINLKVTLQV